MKKLLFVMCFLCLIGFASAVAETKYEKIKEAGIQILGESDICGPLDDVYNGAITEIVDKMLMNKEYSDYKDSYCIAFFVFGSYKETGRNRIFFAGKNEENKEETIVWNDVKLSDCFGFEFFLTVMWDAFNEEENGTKMILCSIISEDDIVIIDNKNDADIAASALMDVLKELQ